MKPYDPLKSIFDDFMERERTTIKDYWTEDRYNVIFRHNSDRNQMNDNSTIYYYADAGIKVGGLLLVEDEYYITLNQQSVENKIYKQSDLIKCNTIFNGFSGGNEIVLPAYVVGFSSPYGNDSNVISLASGDVELITQRCKLSDHIVEGTYFYALEGRYSVQKKVNDESGITHIYAKAEAFTSAPTYSIAIDLKDAYMVGTKEALSATAKRTENSVTDIVENPTIIWQSSDNSIVSFEDGIATFNGIGEAQVVAIWREHNIAEVSIVTVSASTFKRCVIAYSGTAEIKTGGSSKAFTAWFYDSHNNVDTSVAPIWEIEYSSEEQRDSVGIVDNTGNSVEIKASSNAPIGSDLFLTLTDTSGEYKTKILIEIVPLWR